MKYIVLAASVLSLAACSPSAPDDDTPPPPPPAAPIAPIAAADDYSTPPEGSEATFQGCTWSEVRGAGVSMWGYQCQGSKLVADPTLPGIVMEFDIGDGKTMKGPVVRLFDIAEGAELASILPAVRAASPAPDNAQCAFAEAPNMAGWQEFRPAGDLMAKYQLFMDGKADGPSMPCGEMGPTEGGYRYFQRLPGSTTKVAVVFLPSEIPAFNPKSIKAAE